MAITYPLSFPSTGGISNIMFTATDVIGISQSPYTFQQQLFQYPGQRWEASVTLPPMKRDDAEEWVGFLLSLKGRLGTFYLNDPNCLEPQGAALTIATNTLAYTESFDNAYWTKSRVLAFGAGSVADAIASPFGDMVADFICEDTTVNNTHSLARNKSFTVGNVYTFSVYLHSSSTRRCRLSFPNAAFGNSSGTFDAATGTIIQTVGAASNMENVGGGWYRCSITATCTATATNAVVFFLISGTTSSYTGDGVSGIYLFGAMLNEGELLPYNGVIASYAPAIDGGSQTGGSINIKGLSPNLDNALKIGDYVQIGSGSVLSLHKCLTNVSTSATGTATLELWPNVRTAYANNTPVSFHSAKGLFRLKENVRSWQINEISSYGISFDCMEAL